MTFIDSYKSSNDNFLSVQAKKCFIFAFIFGFLLGAFILPVWTHNVESAQVLANVLHYSKENPMNIGHRGLYSLLIQIPSVLLSIGFSEWSLCVFFSGFQCAIAFSAVSLLTFIFSHHLYFSLSLPALLLHLSLKQPFWPSNYLAVFHGHAYPLLFPLNTSLYGLIGICCVIIIFCFFSLEWYRSGAFMAGLFPAIHPTLALACWLGLISHIQDIKKNNRFCLVFKFFLGGLIIFGISAVAHFIISRPYTTKITPDTFQCLSQALVSDHQSLHSHLVSFTDGLQFFEPDIYLLIIFFAIIRSSFLTRSMFFFISAMSVVMMIGSIYVPVSLIFPKWLNSFPLNVLMIPRWLNISSVAFPCILTGILVFFGIIHKNTKVFWVTIIYFVLILSGKIKGITISASLNAYYHSIPTIDLLATGWILLLVLTCISLLIFKKKYGEIQLFSFDETKHTLKTILCIMVLGMIVIDSLWIRMYKHSLSKEDEMIINELKNYQGVLLTTAPFWTLAPLQLRSNRELLVDLSQLNGIYYAPQSIPKAREALQDIFHMDLCHPDYKPGNIADVLESKSFKEWQRIALKYKITNILTPGSLILNIPLCFQNKRYRLYCL